MIRRILSLGLIVSLLLMVLPWGTALAQGNVDAYVNTAQLKMRAAPNSRAEAVKVLVSNDTLQLLGRDKDANWLFAQAADSVQGWVASNFLLINNRVVLKNLPIVDTVVGAAPNNNPPAANAGVNPTAEPAQANIPPPVDGGGIGGGFELGGQVRDLNGRTVDALRRSGMTWVKKQAFAGDGNAIGAISAAKGSGFKILLSVIGDKSSVTNPSYQDSYAAFVGTLAASGADAIEVWNEMNIDREWPTGKISPDSYVSLLAKSYNAIKSANRNTIVITGAPAPTGAEGAFGLDRVWNDDRYVAGMVAAGAGRYADCIGIHYNEGIVGPGQSGGDKRGNYDTYYFSTMLRRGMAGFRGKPACYTEIGYLTPEGFPPLPGSFGWASDVTVAQQAAWLAQAAQIGSRSNVRLMIVFNVDFTNYGEDPMAGFAIIRPDGSCPACDTLGNVMR